MRRLYRLLVNVFMVLAIFTTSSLGGGKKCIVPAETEVIPIPEEVFYIGVGLLASGLSRNCQCDINNILKDTTYGLFVKSGWNYNDYLAIEARWIHSPIEKDFSITKHYGIYLRPQYKVAPNINTYATIGYGRTEVEGAGDNNYDTLTRGGLSIGAGVEYSITDSWGVFFDYENLLYNEGIFNVNSNIVSVGVLYTF